MRVIKSEITVSEILDMLERKDLVVNREYQRSANIWPADAKSYFIDTILEGYPFPQLYFYQIYNSDIRKPIKEIVDGQQRVTTLIEFYRNRFRLTSASEKFEGHTFEMLDAESQQRFLLATVHADIIVAAERSDLLEMFRRMNSYTVPLNPSEKRHSTYQGHFKWFINEITDKCSPILQELNIFTDKQIMRMYDTEFLAELAIVIDKGIVNRDAKTINDIYKRNDKAFVAREEVEHKIRDFFYELETNLKCLRNTFIMKPYVIYSLFCAMTHKKYGIPRGDELLDRHPSGHYYRDIDATLANLRNMAEAHELQDLESPYSEYVEACLSTTHRVAQRKTRAIALYDALV